MTPAVRLASAIATSLTGFLASMPASRSAASALRTLAICVRLADQDLARAMQQDRGLLGLPSSRA